MAPGTQTQTGHLDSDTKSDIQFEDVVAQGSPLFGKTLIPLTSGSFSEEEPAPEPKPSAPEVAIKPVGNHSECIKACGSSVAGCYQRRFRPSQARQKSWHRCLPASPAGRGLMVCAGAVVGACVACLATLALLQVTAAKPEATLETSKPGVFRQGIQSSPGGVPRSELVAIELTRMYVPLHTVGGAFQFFSAYHGDIEVAGQTFKVMFDTGSGNVILPSTYCTTETCKRRSRYARRNSATAVDLNYEGQVVRSDQKERDLLSIVFGTGSVDGVLVQDEVCPVVRGGGAEDGAGVALVGDESQGRAVFKSCSRMAFVAATEMSPAPFDHFTFDGVVGLALPAISHNKHFNFVESMAPRMGNWEHRKTFSVFLAASGAEETSEITFGGWDSGHIAADSAGEQQISWQAVKHADLGHWILSLTGVYVEAAPGQTTQLDVCLNENCSAAMDTGTGTLALPKEHFKPLYRKLFHRPTPETLCLGDYPKVHLELTDFNVTLGPADFSAMVNSEGPIAEENTTKPEVLASNTTYCKPLLMILNLEAPLGPNLYVIGEPAMRKYYTIYDAENARIGISLAKHTASEEVVLAPSSY